MFKPIYKFMTCKSTYRLKGKNVTIRETCCDTTLSHKNNMFLSIQLMSIQINTTKVKWLHVK